MRDTGQIPSVKYRKVQPDLYVHFLCIIRIVEMNSEITPNVLEVIISNCFSFGVGTRLSLRSVPTQDFI